MGFAITVQSDVSLAGPDEAVSVILNYDGSFSIGAGNASANFSSEGALEGLTDGNWGFTGDGISYTDTVTQAVGPDQVTADMTATVEPSADTPPNALSPGLEKAGRVAGAVGLGVIIWWLLKPACVFTGPGVPACVVIA